MRVRRRTQVLWIVGAVAFASRSPSQITRHSFHGWVDTTALLAEWGVALGTFGLALATVMLARRAHQEAHAVTQQVALEREQLVAAQRPLVLPLMSGGDLVAASPDEHVALTNAGVGAAMNVRGFMWWSGRAGGSAMRSNRRTTQIGAHAPAATGPSRRVTPRTARIVLQP